jgi:tetratricopeptide (TPR) repeat protein
MTKSSPLVDAARIAVTLALFSVAAIATTPAEAAPPSPAAQERLARLHFEAGKQAYELGRFADAAIEFQRGYDLSHLPLFLLNLGHAYFALDRFADAIAACQQYLAAKPNDAVHVREAEELLTSAERHKQLQAPAPTPVPEVAPTPPPVVAETPPPSEPAPPPRRHGPRRPALAWTGVVGVVVGAGAVAGGAALLVIGNNLNNDFNHPAPGTVYDHNTVTRFQTDHNAGVGLLVAGGVVLVAGTVAAILGWRGGREASATAWWAPSAAANALAASPGFRF